MTNDSEAYEQLLVLRAQDGDQSAMSGLIEHWQVRLTRYALHLTGSSDGAADVMQEVWLSVVRSLRRLDDPSRFRPWVYRIVANKCTDWIRARARSRNTTEPLEANDVAAAAPTADTSNEMVRLRGAIGQLPAEKRMILAMFYLDDVSICDIAQLLNIPEGTVKSRLFHARNQLKQILGVENHEDD